jgi:hypothetical protein
LNLFFKVNKNRQNSSYYYCEYCESKFSLFVGQKLTWNVDFWPKTYENTVFSKFWSMYSLGCQYSHRKIVERQNMHHVTQASAAGARCVSSCTVNCANLKNIWKVNCAFFVPQASATCVRCASSCTVNRVNLKKV